MMSTESYDSTFSEIKKHFAGAFEGALTLLDLARTAVESRQVLSESELREHERLQDDMKKALERAVVSTLVNFVVPPGDVRRIVGIVRSTADLERIGDNSVQIVVAIREANHQNIALPEMNLGSLFDQVRALVSSAVETLLNEDIQKISHNRELEQDVDEQYKRFTRELVTRMMGDTTIIPGALILWNVIRRLERIADHAGNIIEHYISIVKEEA
ncbi:MAG: PhoU domain-containing protein [bacterium JZ-2024 1]